MGTRQLTGAALTSKMIKKRLTALYPGVKFSVKSDVFSMGDSVDIKWTDGPMLEDIEKITRQYQHGSFNGMEDIYEHKEIDASLECPGAKYVQCSREFSREYQARLEVKAKEYYGDCDHRDHSYRRKLNEVEKKFFPYQSAVPTSTAANQGTASITALDYEIIKDVDTRNNNDIFVVKVKTKVDDFNTLRQEMGELGGYYSRFKKGFIFKDDPTAKLANNYGHESATVEPMDAVSDETKGSNQCSEKATMANSLKEINERENALYKYWEGHMPEADSELNNMQHEKIAAVYTELGTAFIGKINVRERESMTLENVFTEYKGEKVYNFGADFVIPIKDDLLAEMILKWNSGLPTSVSLISRINKRIDEIGGANLLWS